jgi:hypothetical protein
MKYWDSSAIVPLLVEQRLTKVITELYGNDNSIITWWESELECASLLRV